MVTDATMVTDVAMVSDVALVTDAALGYRRCTWILLIIKKICPRYSLQFKSAMHFLSQVTYAKTFLMDVY